MWTNAWADVRYALRTLGRSPGFAVAAIGPLALGIGLNTGVFSVFENMMYGLVPVPGADQLVTVYQDVHGGGRRSVHGARSMFSRPEYEAYRDATRTLAGMTAYSAPWQVTVGSPNPQDVEGVLVACNYFDVLQVRPAIGTAFGSECERAKARPTVVLSHALWTRAFHADPGVVGRPVALSGLDVVVAGVAPAGFDGTEVTRAAFFAPLSLQAALDPEEDLRSDPQVSWLTLVGRRRRGATIDQARAELAMVAGRIDSQQPGRSTTLVVAPAVSVSLPVARRNVAGIAGIVAVAFGLILVIACANVANVLLARGEARSREMATRLAIGASRGRIVRLLLAESAVVAFAGGVAGSILAWWSFRAMLPAMLAELPRVSHPRLDADPDPTVLGFGLAVTIGTAVACGIVPAVVASRPRLYGSLAHPRVDARGRPRSWLRSSLVGVQVAVCFVLLVGAALLLRALQAAYTIDPGFTSKGVTIVSVDLRGTAHAGPAPQIFAQQLSDALASLPRTTGVAQVGKLPLSPGRREATFRLPNTEEDFEFDVNAVSPDYFAVLGIPIVNGRTFTRAECDRGGRAAIVTAATARRFWPGQDPVGKTIVPASGPALPLEIVGVAADAHVSRIADTDATYLYLAAGSSAEKRLTFLVKSDLRFEALVAAVRSRIATLDDGLVADVRPLEANLELWRREARAVASLAGSLSGLALVLACAGLYGVVSYVVTCRRREVGIRLALGASPGAIHAQMVAETLQPVSLGLIAGIGGAVLGSRLLENRLYGVSRFDPVAFAVPILALLTIAALATVLPSWQSLRTDPMAALRRE